MDDGVIKHVVGLVNPDGIMLASVKKPPDEAINHFERRLADNQVTIVECFLHVSRAVQAERLPARLDDLTKYWKYNPGDVDVRGYREAYRVAHWEAPTRCNTVSAPWHLIPSDRKWYRNWAVAALLAEALEKLDPQYPRLRRGPMPTRAGQR